MPVYAWKMFLENVSELVSIIPPNKESETKTFRKYHNFAISYGNQQRKGVCMILYYEEI